MTVRRTVAFAVMVACAFPLGYLLLLSVSGAWPFPCLLPARLQSWTWSQIGASGLGGSVWLSSGLAGAVAAISTGTGYLVGRTVAYSAARRWLLLLAYLPWTLSPVVLGVCLLYVYLRAGLVGSVIGVAIAHTMLATGFAIVYFSAFWTPRVRAMEELAHTLGGSRWQALTMVLLPTMRPAILVCLAQTFLISWFQYGVTLLIGAGRVQTLPLRVFMFVGEANPTFAAAAGLLLVVPSLLLTWANRRVLRTGKGVV